jgi:DNA-binding response OmpR family regulator
MSQNFRILVFEDDTEHVQYLKKILHTPGCELVFEDNLYQATQRFKSQPFDLSVINLETADEDGEELAWWLIDNYPRRSVILTGGELYPEQEELLSYKAVLGFFPAPLHPETLSQMLKKDGKGLKGQVQRMRIPDLLQALRWSQDAVILVFVDASLQQEGWLYLKQGEIVHAEIYQRSTIGGRKSKVSHGTEAFQKILKFRNGDFTEQIWQEPEERSLNVPFDGLMMNAATQQDENESTLEQHHGPRIRRALLIDEDAISRMMLQRSLLAEGIDCESVRSLSEAALELKTNTVDLLILDAGLPLSDFKLFIERISPQYPHLRTLLLGEPGKALEKLEMSALHTILPRPVNPKRLKEILFEMTQVGFKGYLSRISVLDFLQLNLSAIDEQKKIHIRDLQSGVDGQIYLNQGRFIHAEFDELVGEEAFYKIAAIEQGDFFEDPAFQPPDETLANILPHKLMINAGRFAAPIEEAPASPSTEEEGSGQGLTSLFGDDDDIQFSFGENDTEGGITSLFGDDDDIQFSFAEGLQPDLPPTDRPTEQGLTSLFSEDELDDIQFSLGD